MGSAAEFVPSSRSLATLRRAAKDCHGCPLWKDATQTVFGAGSRTAELMLVGEQPGDREDIEGKPFVGPAGRVLSRALDEASIDTNTVYLTNAVKHFKWQKRGKRRLHQTPLAGEINACKPWLEAELEAVKPQGLVALGATAARSLLGPSIRVTRDRGQLIESPLAAVVAVTIHPSANTADTGPRRTRRSPRKPGRRPPARRRGPGLGRSPAVHRSSAYQGVGVSAEAYLPSRSNARPAIASTSAAGPREASLASASGPPGPTTSSSDSIALTTFEAHSTGLT